MREEIKLEVARASKRSFRIVVWEDTSQKFVWVYRLESEGPFTPEAITRWMAVRPDDFAKALLLIWSRGKLEPSAT